MTPRDFLLFSIQNHCYREMSWVVSAFGITKPSTSIPDQAYPGYILREPFGIYFLNEKNEKVQIDVKNINEPLFSKSEQVEITPDWIPSLKEPSAVTTIGILLANLLGCYEPFGERMPYINRKFGPKDIEAILAPRLKSTPDSDDDRSDEFFYVDELEKYYASVSYAETLSHLFTHSVTRIGLLPAPGRKAFKAELIKKYEGKLRDPVYMAQFEKEMGAFDDAYLKNDPAYGKHMSGKVSKSRVKSFMTQGGESNEFIDSREVTPIIQSLDDDIPLDPEGFVAISNTIRYGSHSRGVETINGGVVSKAIGVAVESSRIVVDPARRDCGVTEGVTRLYSSQDIHQLVGRTVIAGSKNIFVSTIEEAKSYLGKKIYVRSPGYCMYGNNETCEVCAGASLAKFPTGLPIPLMGLSGGILKDSLKKMHNATVQTEVLDLRAALS